MLVENIAKGSRIYMCNESITYTTHGDVRYLHNLELLLSSWQAGTNHEMDLFIIIVIIGEMLKFTATFLLPYVPKDTK